MASLGIAESYEAFIYDSYTQTNLLTLPWSSIKWQRVRSDISAAEVTIAQGDRGIECTSAIGGLRAWSQMLVIERDGAVVWDGPIMGWARPGGQRDVTIRARDRSAMFWKRLVAHLRDWSTDSMTAPPIIMKTLLADALLGNTLYDPYPLTILTPSAVTESALRQYYPERLERIYDVLRELCENTTTGFWTTLRDQVYLSEADVWSQLGLASSGYGPVLNDETVIGLPGIDVDGSGMATDSYAGGAGTGTSGFPLIGHVQQHIFLTATLERSAAQDRVSVTTDLTLTAARGLAESAGPAATLEQFELSPLFGSERMTANLDNLLPGSQFPIDFADTVAFDIAYAEYRETSGVPGIAYTTRITAARLDQLDVQVSKPEGGGVSEKVLASLRPIITSSYASSVGNSSPASAPGVDQGSGRHSTSQPDRDCGLDGSFCP